MKLSKIIHVLNVVVGFGGIITAIVAVNIGANDTVWGFTKEHWLLCALFLMLVAIWLSVNTIHHVMIEKR